MKIFKWMFLAYWCAVLPVTVCNGQDTEDYSLEQLRKERKASSFRQRRIILNNDGNDEPAKDKKVTPETFLQSRTTGLETTQVDSIFYCTGVYNFYSHNSEVSEIYKRKAWALELIRQGADSLEVMTRWCRDHRREIFWSMRMNDTHDASKPHLLTRWKKEHPDYLMGKPGDWFPHGDLRWSALNYELEPVRSKTIAILTDVCTRYDIDGIELDFFRHPAYFRETLQGGEATAAQRDLMTDMIRKIRTMTESAGLRRKRPLMVAIRIPDSLGYCRALGLDVQRWLEEGLIDLVTGGGYFKLEPWQQLVATGRQYEVPVYAALVTRRLIPETEYEGGDFRNLSPHLLAVFRGEAYNALRAGVNGIYLFNQFDPNNPMLHDLGDLGKLEGKPRKEQTAYVQQYWSRPEVWLASANNYFKGTQSYDDPATIINENLKPYHYHGQFHYKRKIIYNSDGNENLVGKAVTPESFLANRTAGLENTDVSSIFYCTGLTLAFTHRTKVAERYGYNGLGEERKSFAAELDEHGIDSLGLMIDYARRRHKEIFWSLRMNDRHDSDTENAKLLPQWKKDHPEYLMGRPGDSWPYGADSWSALNYACPPVRNRIFDIIQEVSLNYDVDGIELDFFRHPVFFKEVMEGHNASEKSLTQMSELIRRIRRITQDVSWRRGRPILIAIRIPDSLEYCKGIGLDVETWLREDLVDLVIGGGYFKLNPWEYLANIGKKYKVPVYACTVQRRIASEQEAKDTELLHRRFRGEALAAWEAGMNGIYTFNLWYQPQSPHAQLFTQLGDPERLRSLPHEAGAPACQEDGWSKPQTWLVDGNRYINR